jgi:hypothetical protein
MVGEQVVLLLEAIGVEPLQGLPCCLMQRAAAAGAPNRAMKPSPRNWLIVLLRQADLSQPISDGLHWLAR